MVNENSVKDVVREPYKYGFVTDIETEKIEKGLNEDIIKLISQKKEEPKFLLDFRLKAFKKWQKMKEPDWDPRQFLESNVILLFLLKSQHFFGVLRHKFCNLD